MSAWETAATERDRKILNLAAFAINGLRLQDTPNTLPNVLRGLYKFCRDGWQHARPLPCGYVIRISHATWVSQTATWDGAYCYVQRIGPVDKETAALLRVFNSDSWIRQLARSIY